MSTWENDIESIEAYLNGKLTVEERLVVEKRLAEDAEFARQFEELKLLKQGTRLSKMKSVLDSLKETEANLEPIEVQAATSIRPLWQKITAAASIILLIGFAWYLLRPGNIDPEQIFAETFEPYPNNVIKRSQENQHSELKLSAYQAYDQKAYEESIRQFQQLFAEESDSLSLLYLGNAYLATGKTDLAIEKFLLYLPSAGIFTNSTKWYLSMAYLQKGDLKNAKVLLEELAAGDHSYASKAKETLKKL